MMTTYKGAIELTSQNSAFTRDEFEAFITELVSNYQNEITGLKFDTVKVSLVEINDAGFQGFLKGVPQAVIKRIEECARSYGFSLNEVDKIDLHASFIFADTEEGHDVWAEVYLGNYEPFYKFWNKND